MDRRKRTRKRILPRRQGWISIVFCSLIYIGIQGHRYFLLFMLEKSGQFVTRSRLYSDSPFLGSYYKNPYQPLENALLKSTVKQPQVVPTNYLPTYSPISSRVASSSQPISHAEAQRIKSELIIPNGTLIPTKNMERVRGKTFRTVGVEERMGKPLTEEEFRRFRTREVEEIVYEIQEEDDMNKIYTYTTATTRENLPQEKSTRRKAATAYQDTPLGHTKQQQRQQKWLQFGKKQSRKVGQESPPNMQQIFPLSSQRKYTYTYNHEQNEVVFQLSGDKPYNFKQEQLALYAPPEKKPNLFSILDECGNRGCRSGCWKGNEVCAPKLSSSSWK